MAVSHTMMLQDAERIVRDCIGEQGIWAGTQRYRNQYWTRDFGLAGFYILMHCGLSDTARKHLLMIVSRQKSSGQVPMMISERRHSIASLLRETFANDGVRGTLEKGFSFFRTVGFSRAFSLDSLSSWTADSELLFILPALEYIRRSGDTTTANILLSAAKKALAFSEKNRVRHTLIYGADWRDMMHHLDTCALLSNNAILYRIYVLLGEREKAEILRDHINDLFWAGSYYRDRLNSQEFDLLGQSFAVLYGIVPSERYEAVARKLANIETPFGFPANDNVLPSAIAKHNPGASTNQYGTLWPFIHGYAVCALVAMGFYEAAERALEKFFALASFYEWYDAQSGQPLGEREQMWSAALLLLAYNAVMRHTGDV